jgi:D-glycero-alpha-D-manno-heptose-7-phosphate kinase
MATCESHYNGGVHLESSAPTRIDLAGGTIDIWPLYLFHPGAVTLNAAISLRAHARLDSRDDGRVVIRSIDTGRTTDVAHWSELVKPGDMDLLGRLLHYFRAEGLTLTTRAQSPAGAGIAGSSALNVAVCGAMAKWTGRTIGDEALLEIARNVEAQAIFCPTGVQDYRPAMYGGVSAVELDVDGVRRVGLSVDPKELERRIVLVYTGAPRNSGTNNWEMTKRHLDGDREVIDCFDRIRDTAVAMRTALEAGDWTEVGQQIAQEWENRKRLAPGVTTPQIDDLIARAGRAGATAAKVCGAGGGGCLFCYAEPGDAGRVREALAAGGARVLDYRIETEGLRLQ